MTFLANHLTSSPGSSSTDDTTPKQWPGFQAASSQLPLATDCLTAFSKVFFGRRNNAQTITVYGLRAYQLVLEKLNFLLGQCGSASSDDVLLSSMILSMYEFTMSTSGTGWIVHALGLGRLIQLGGPVAYRVDHRRDLLEYNRFMIVLASLATGQSTFLSSDEWKRPSPSNVDTPPDVMHRLVDIYVDLPALKEETMALDSDVKPNNLVVLLNRGLEIMLRLQEWNREWSQLPQSQVNFVRSTINYPDTPNPSDTCFEYTSFQAAHTASLHNAAILQTVEIVLTICKAADNVLTQSDMLAQIDLYGLRSSSRIAALHICRSMEYQIRQNFGAIGPLFVLFPLRMAYKALGRGSTPEGKWLERLLIDMREQAGWAVANHSTVLEDAAFQVVGTPAS